MRTVLFSLILALLPLLLTMGGSVHAASKKTATGKRPAAKAKRPVVKGKAAVARRGHRTRKRSVARRSTPKPPTRNFGPFLEPVDVMPNGLTALPILSLSIPTYPPPPPVPGTCLTCTKPLLATAYSLIGTPYRWGGRSPENGFDCSGFVRYVYQSNFSLALPTSAPAQFHIGVPVEKSELLPGDLVFFHHRRRGWHVGMYVGGGSFIHAPNRRKTVMVTPLSDPYFSVTYVGARRIPLADLEAAGGLDVETNN